MKFIFGLMPTGVENVTDVWLKPADTHGSCDYPRPYATARHADNVEELQAFRSRMMANKDAEKVIAPHVISSEHVTRLMGTSISGRQTTNLLLWRSFDTVIRANSDRTKHVDADYPPPPCFHLPVATPDRRIIRTNA